MQANTRATAAAEVHTLSLATAALMIEVMRADFAVVESERQAVQTLLQKQLFLSTDEVDELFALAEQEVIDSVSLFQFTSLIDQNMPYAQKVRIIEMLWQVVYADHNLDKYEESMVRKIADLLHVSHRDFIQSKHRLMPD
jgi:uncharacterized tellurite resistance protein B-like protein